MNQGSQSRELKYAFFVIIILSGVYVAYEILAEPRGGHPFGHWLGILGALLMLMTETLYSLRKRTRLFSRTGADCASCHPTGTEDEAERIMEER
jgi:hypothetical protein